MDRKESSKGRASPGRREFYALLGVTAQGDGDAEEAHNELVQFLKGAPDSVRQWAEDEIAAADRAYELLSNPAAAQTARPRPIKRFAVGVAVVAIAVGVGVGIYQMGGSPGTPKVQESKASQGEKRSLSSTEEAEVDQLMKKVLEKPKDVASMVRLGNIFFGAGDYSSTGSWMARAVRLDPKNVDARLALGAAQFNLGGAADAERQWLRVTEIDPKNIEAYYDLGFLYLSKKKPDMAAAKRAWSKVIEIAPKSSAAETVADHLKHLKNSKTLDSSSSPVAPKSGSGQ